ncbi:potassium-transporting ATPase subunit KdpA [Dyella caseinilytica]|uniref:Potassium-transporting ATPase potassium-binding subunit n=1 Tax=Dyella caseinilytica TaxID=1849581 RepID=A0ABX7GUT3_9GAMM|nr:potassium-transporting ATPase subunit KdpA [Dyella caseinilytica]QRN53818.1 potassium-transporting ATPase subunit KdpA [Dyella caseinilytica]GFZ89403.1 potassium-transporting ATPase potassium-binding subunit [Dyella caseinilytica]
MNPWNIVQYGVFLLVLMALVKPVGGYLTRVFFQQTAPLDGVLGPVERALYRLCGVDPKREMGWKMYTLAFLLFSFAGTLLLYVILRIQPLGQPPDPAFQPAPLSPDLAMNTAISFATTTTWQAYSGESSMSYLSQMVGLAAQNFLAGAAGLSIGVAFIRGIVRQRSGALGNFWVDITRSILWVLLPISLIGALFLVWQGVPQNWHPYVAVTTLQGAQQTLAQGPVAALEFIKNLGTNGGGFFNANGAHPYANPTPLTNVVGMLAIAVLPAALTYTFGQVSGQQRHGWLLFIVMALLFCAGLWICDRAEQAGNPRFVSLGIEQTALQTQPGGNMEGKELRFGIGQSVLTSITTSNGATGSVNAMHDSYTPIGGGVTIFNMLLGEPIFGGLGTGIYSIIMYVLIAVFLGGLMIGRTPEYLGKTLNPTEMRLVALYTIIGPMFVLTLTALALSTKAGVAGLTTNTGPHGFSEVLVAYATTMANNGQSFAGLSANSAFYNITTAIAMTAGRYWLAIPALALAGRFAAQGHRVASSGTLPTDTPLFGGLVVAAMLIIGGLSYFPALAMGPIVEHLLLHP